MAEGRLSRWSRLKQKGGADEREEKRALEDREQQAVAQATATPEAVRLPGGARVRNFVPAMAPLAPDAEDDDDRLTRGVGHADEDPEAAEAGTARETSIEELIEDIEERELTEEEKAVVADLPPLDTLTAESDYTPFLRQGVPDFLKRKALRMLWLGDPFFNIRDGLNDYDLDYNVVFKLIDSMTGNYQVGRGFLSEKELRDMTPKAARQAAGEDDDDEEEVEDLTEDKPCDASADAAAKSVDADGEDDDEVGDGEDEPVG